MDYRCISVTIMYYIVIQKAYQYENLALNKTATVSQRYNNKDFDPRNAVDGDDSTDLLKCSLTASGQKEAWLTVDLMKEKNIASISFIHGGLGTNAKPIDYRTSGIYRRGTSSTVETSPSGRRWLCHDHFTANDAKVVCLIWGLLPDNGYIGGERVNYIPMEDKNYDCVGNEAVITDCSKNYDSCSSAGDFASRTSLNCKEGDTLAGFSVYVSNTLDWRSGTLCYQCDIKQPSNYTVNIDCFTSGRYVTIYNSRFQTNVSSLFEFAYINICEINITGCNIGFYGENCTKCPDSCLNNVCHFQSGHCFDCKDGFNGEMCKECPLTVYGPNCNTSCGEHCQRRICNHVTGHCLACAEDRSGNLCENELPAKATLDTVSVLTATTTVSSVLVVVFTLYMVKKKCLCSRQTPTRKHDLPEMITIDSKYETLQRKKTSDEVENNSAAEYMEIEAISSEYINLNLK